METTHSIVAGALYDFLGMLTTATDLGPDPIIGAHNPPYVIIRKLEEWAQKRGLDLSCADVHRWQQRLGIDKPEIIASGAFVKDLETLLNKYSIENGSNTPDFVLANVIVNMLYAWNNGVQRREEWFGRPMMIRGIGMLPGDLPEVPPNRVLDHP